MTYEDLISILESKYISDKEKVEALEDAQASGIIDFAEAVRLVNEYVNY